MENTAECTNWIMCFYLTKCAVVLAINLLVNAALAIISGFTLSKKVWDANLGSMLIVFIWKIWEFYTITFWD